MVCLYRDTLWPVVRLAAWTGGVGPGWGRCNRYGGSMLLGCDWCYWCGPCDTSWPTCQCGAGIGSKCHAWLGQDAAVLSHVPCTCRLPHWLTVSNSTYLSCTHILRDMFECLPVVFINSHKMHCFNGYLQACLRTAVLHLRFTLHWQKLICCVVTCSRNDFCIILLI